MANVINQRLWIAVHLLYPNSSQALDVYHNILVSLPKKADSDYAKNIYLRLEIFFSKNPAVRSAQPFRVFENYSLTTWETLYRKLSKKNILVVIGILVFNFKIEEVSVLLKIPHEKVRFLINQALKKVVREESLANDANNEFKFRKVDDKIVSYFFTNENLVEYCLNILNPEENILVQQGLTLYPQLVILYRNYIEIIEELRNIVQSELRPSETPISQQQVATVSSNLQKPRIRQSWLIVSALSITFLIFVAFRPITFKSLPLKLGSKSIKMLEVNSQPYLAEKDMLTNQGSPINLKEMPVNTLKVTGEKVQMAKSADLQANKQNANEVRQGGLYRASIQVSDLDALTSRITEKLVALGGKKAGEVELGWKKSAKLAYYHLILPAESVDEARSFLARFGKLNIQFENHPRLMPAGFKRMILEVKEGE